MKRRIWWAWFLGVTLVVSAGCYTCPGAEDAYDAFVEYRRLTIPHPELTPGEIKRTNDLGDQVEASLRKGVELNKK